MLYKVYKGRKLVFKGTREEVGKIVGIPTSRMYGLKRTYSNGYFIESDEPHEKTVAEECFDRVYLHLNQYGNTQINATEYELYFDYLVERLKEKGIEIWARYVPKKGTKDKIGNKRFYLPDMYILEVTWTTGLQSSRTKQDSTNSM